MLFCLLQLYLFFKSRFHFIESSQLFATCIHFDIEVIRHTEVFQLFKIKCNIIEAILCMSYSICICPIKIVSHALDNLIYHDEH